VLSTDPLAGELRARGVTHRRSIRWSDREVSVDDELQGGGSHLVESRLPLAPGADPGLVDGIGLPVALEEGWLSERLFERARTQVVVARGKLNLPARLGWRIVLKEPS